MLREFLRDQRGSCALGHVIMLGMAIVSAVAVAHEARNTIEPMFARVELALKAVALATR